MSDSPASVVNSSLGSGNDLICRGLYVKIRLSLSVSFCYKHHKLLIFVINVGKYTLHNMYGRLIPRQTFNFLKPGSPHFFLFQKVCRCGSGDVSEGIFGVETFFIAGKFASVQEISNRTH